jgi:hypothetical protein
MARTFSGCAIFQGVRLIPAQRVFFDPGDANHIWIDSTQDMETFSSSPT